MQELLNKQLTTTTTPFQGKSSTSAMRPSFARTVALPPHFALQLCKIGVGMVLALIIFACLTNPRVRFGRSPDELNIWAPFRFYTSRKSPCMEARQSIPFRFLVRGKKAASRAAFVPLLAPIVRGQTAEAALTFAGKPAPLATVRLRALLEMARD